MPRAVRCECRTKCSQIDSASMEAKKTSSKGVGDGHCNGNEEESGNQDKVEQNALMFYQHLYVA